MEEVFAIPAVGAIIERCTDGVPCILLQKRQKEGGGADNGLLEIPAGKLRTYESVYDGLRREVREETGLTVVSVKGQEEREEKGPNGYRTLRIAPFCVTQNLSGGYSILLLTFLCRAEGDLLARSDEAEDFQWVPLDRLRRLMQDDSQFYAMHLPALRQYLAWVQSR